MPTRMRPIRDTISIDDARALIESVTVPIDRTESVSLAEANGRVVARDVVSDQDVPPFSRAGMDGYAVHAEDTFETSKYQPKALRAIEQVYTGQVPTRTIGPQECAEIATGAPLPAGANAVVMVEETDTDENGRVSVFSPVYPGQNVGRQGGDIRSGQVILARGDLINASRVGALAAIGRSDVDVFAKPRVAVLSTGNELAEPGRRLEPGQIYDINRFTISAVVGEHGGVAAHFTTSQDTLAALDAAIDACLAEDLIVFSGGSSVGERDLMLDALRKRGHVLFHGIAVKPGKPTGFGTIGSTPVFGLPGYPTSCLSNVYMLVMPMLRAIARLPAHRLRSIQVPLAQRVVSITGRHQFFTVRVVDGLAHPAFKASGDITSMSQADGYIEIRAQTDIVEKGEMVDVKLF